MSVYKDAKRGTWYVTTRYKDWQGEPRWRTKRGFSTKHEALDWEREFLAQKKGDLSMRFETFAQLYLEEITPRMKVSSMPNKKSMLERRLVPYFGSKRMCEISSMDIVRWQNSMLTYRDPKTGQPFSENYLRGLNAQLGALFRYAQTHYKLKENPMENLKKIGSATNGKADFWTLEEYEKFSRECKADPFAYICFETLYWTGLREGEMLALTSADFNFEKRTVSITKTYHRLKKQDVYTTPKTRKGIRIVELPEKLCRELQDYLQMKGDLDAGERIFPVKQDYLYSRMKKYAEKAGVKRIRIHDIRHSHVSLLINMGFDALQIGDRIGHESADVTYHYAHLFPNARKTVSERLSQVMEGSSVA